MAAFANTRRWARHEVDLPVRVFTREIPQAVPGRGTELSEGGMALYAGVELKTSETLEVEFVAASRARVSGVVRSRQGYCFGLEFTTPLPIDCDFALDRAWPGTKELLEPGPLSPGAHQLFQKIKAARGNAAAYALLAQVLLLAGRRDEARIAADRAFRFFQLNTHTAQQQRNARREQMLLDLQAIRAIMLLVVESYDRGVIDPRLKAMLSELPKLLGRQPR